MKYIKVGGHKYSILEVLVIEILGLIWFLSWLLAIWFQEIWFKLFLTGCFCLAFAMLMVGSKENKND